VCDNEWQTTDPEISSASSSEQSPKNYQKTFLGIGGTLAAFDAEGQINVVQFDCCSIEGEIFCGHKLMSMTTHNGE